MSDSASFKLSKELSKIANNLDKEIKEAAGERIAFTLIVFTTGRASYISSCDRKDSIREIKHLLELWDNDMPDAKAHDVQ